MFLQTFSHLNSGTTSAGNQPSILQFVIRAAPLTTEQCTMMVMSLTVFYSVTKCFTRNCKVDGGHLMGVDGVTSYYETFSMVSICAENYCCMVWANNLSPHKTYNYHPKKNGNNSVIKIMICDNLTKKHHSWSLIFVVIKLQSNSKSIPVTTGK